MNIQTVRNLRRASQVVFFLIFFWLILKTTFEVDFSLPKSPKYGCPTRSPSPSSSIRWRR